MTRVSTFLVLFLTLALNATLLVAAPVFGGSNGTPMVGAFDKTSPNALVLFISADEPNVAKLTWTGGNTGDTYTVERSFDGISWSIIDTTTAIEYEDVIQNICGRTTLYYRVTSPVGVSNSVNEILEDTNPPADPTNVKVTINDDGFAVLDWSPSPSDDVVGYIINTKEGNGYQPYPIIINDTIFLDDGPGHKNPCDEVVTYVVRSIDQCGNESAGNGVYQTTYDFHNTILLEYESASLCGKKVRITWNKYNNMKPEVSSYIVQMNVVGQPTLTAKTIRADSTLAFVSDLLTPGVIYEFRVLATNKINVSSSCQQFFMPNYDASSLDIDYVTVTDDDYVTLSLTTDNPAEIDNIQIFRKTNKRGIEIDDGDFELIDEIEWTAAGNTLTYNDNDVNVNAYSYSYHAVAIDGCGNHLDVTDDLKTILLELATRDNGTTAELEFNAIEDGATYQLFRYENGVLSSAFPKRTLPPSEEDDASKILNSANTYYFIEATYADGTKVRSNSVQLPVKINVPNAFRPSGKNPVFRPVLQNIESPYLFTIYNNWGQMVFETNDPYEGWDGGDYPRGIYVYRITCKDQNGTSVSQNGWVMMLK